MKTYQCPNCERFFEEREIMWSNNAESEDVCIHCYSSALDYDFHQSYDRIVEAGIDKGDCDE